MDQHSFHWADYLVFCLTIAFSVLIGVYFACSGNKQKTTREYFIGNRNLHFLPVTVSLLVTTCSGISVLGNPAEVYSYGTMYSLMILAKFLASTFSAIFIVPLFYKLRLGSVAEYYELRFNSKPLRYTVSVLQMLQMLLLSSIQLYAPSVALKAVSGIPVWVSIVAVGVASTIYTALGGIKAVIWTDVFQSVVLLAGLIAISIQGVLSVGGLTKVWEINVQWQRVEFLDFDTDLTKRFTAWSVVLGFGVAWVSVLATQIAVQRYTCLPTLKKARVAVLSSIPFEFIVVGLTSFIGFVAFAYYANVGCDPVRAGYIYSSNQILPYFVAELLSYPGIPGLFIACLFSASLSTLSSALNSVAAMAFEDCLKERISHLDSSTQANTTKIIVLILGFVSIGLAFAIQNMGGTLMQMTFGILGATLCPILGVLLVGSTLPKVGKHLALFAFLVGYAFPAWLTFGSIIYKAQSPPLPSPSYACEGQNISATVASYVDYNGTNLLVTKVINTHLLDNVTTKASVVEPIQDGEKSFVMKMYSISYLFIPMFGTLLVYIMCLLAMWIPGLQHKGEVPLKLLLPYVRKLPCYGKRQDEEEISDEDKDKDEARMKLNENKEDVVEYRQS